MDDGMMMEDEVMELTDKGKDELAYWVTSLINGGYNLTDPLSIWQAAGYLIAQGFSEMSIDETAVMLAFVCDDWDLLKETLES